MKSQNYTNILCACIIGISVITGSLIIHNTDNQKQIEIINTQENKDLKPLVTVKEAADYLGIPETEVWQIINAQEDQNDLIMRFPIVEIEDKTYVSTIGLIEWLKAPSQTDESKGDT